MSLDEDGFIKSARPVERSGSHAQKRRRVATTQIAIGELMADGAPRRPSEIATTLGLTTGAASAAMGRMARAGVLTRIGRGQYQWVNVEPDPINTPLRLHELGKPEAQAPPHAATGRPVLSQSIESNASTTTQQQESPHATSRRGEIARAAFAAKLWLKDAALFRLDDYHWEKRRRRRRDHDRKTGRAAPG